MVGPLVLRDEGIDQALALLERLTDRTVLRPQTMPAATITLSLQTPVTKAEAIQAIETVLGLNGIAVTPRGTRYLIATSLAQAKAEAPEFIDDSTLGLPPTGKLAQKTLRTEISPRRRVRPASRRPDQSGHDQRPGDF